MSQKRYNFGIIGFGEIAEKSHAPAIEQMGGTFFATSQEGGLDSLLRTGVDVISICTPNYLHVNQAIAALDAGKKVILEKPIATTLKDAQRLINHPLSDTVAVCYQRRYNKECQEIKQIKREDIEKVVAYIDVRRDPYYWRTWRSDKKKSGGGAVINIAIHYLDLLLWWLGDKYSIEFAQIAMLKNYPIDGVAVAQMDFDGIPVRFTTNAINDVRDIKMKVYLKDGTIKTYKTDDATHYDVYNNFLNKGEFVTPREAYKSLQLVQDIYKMAESR